MRGWEPPRRELAPVRQLVFNKYGSNKLIKVKVVFKEYGSSSLIWVIQAKRLA
jgi:hypothetical protein